MIKLRSLTLTGFRGVRFSIPVDFTKANRSISVYGDNASGKSSFTDALEWLIHQRVGHLWREDCYAESLRNVLLDAGQPSEVSVEFSNSLKNTKQLSAALTTVDTNSDGDYREFISAIRNDNIFLRHADITNFIQKTKSDKREEIASIIGYESFSNFRDAIQGTRNALEKDSQYINAKHEVENSKTASLKLAGRFLESRDTLYEQITAEIEREGFSFKVHDPESNRSAHEALQAQINQKERLQKKLLLDELIKDATALRDKIPVLKAHASFFSEYNSLIEEKASLEQIHLQNFLTSGAKILDAGYVTDSKCPLCLSTVDLAKLRSEIDSRLAAIGHIAEKLRKIATDTERLSSQALDVKTLCDRISTHYTSLTSYRRLTAAAKDLSDSLGEFRTDTAKKVGSHQPLVLTGGVFSKLESAVEIANATIGAAKTEADSLQFTEYENRIIKLLERLRALRTVYHSYETNSKIVASFEKQILSLGNIFEKFLRVQNAALQTVLDRISEDVGDFYKVLHPAENADAVKLKVTGGQGIEFEFSFHGKPTHPPMKYLSESHLNSLGVVLFLASARLFNKASRFLVLDDIVTSFDANHRRRLLRLLKEQFADWQIVLLTHEPFWFEMIKKELMPDGWLVFDVVSDNENGTLLEPSARDIRALIQIKRKNSDVSNDLRKLLEATLKEICFKLGVKVAFQYNDENERRMSGELMSALRSTLNRKCQALKDNPIFANLAGSSLVVNVGSHDNPERISGGDIDVSLDDIEKLRSLFECPKCHAFVSHERTIPGNDKIACKCGQLELEWKQ